MTGSAYSGRSLTANAYISVSAFITHITARRVLAISRPLVTGATWMRRHEEATVSPVLF